MSIITRARKQKAVLWEEDGVDVYGAPKFKDPVEIDCRWDGVSEQFVDSDGSVKVSRARVMVDRDFNEGSLLKRTTLASIDQSKGGREQDAWEVRKFENIPNLRATEFLRIAIL